MPQVSIASLLLEIIGERYPFFFVQVIKHDMCTKLNSYIHSSMSKTSIKHLQSIFVTTQIFFWMAGVLFQQKTIWESKLQPLTLLGSFCILLGLLS